MHVHKIAKHKSQGKRIRLHRTSITTMLHYRFQIDREYHINLQIILLRYQFNISVGPIKYI